MEKGPPFHMRHLQFQVTRMATWTLEVAGPHPRSLYASIWPKGPGKAGAPKDGRAAVLVHAWLNIKKLYDSRTHLNATTSALDN